VVSAVAIICFLTMRGITLHGSRLTSERKVKSGDA